MSLVRWFRKNNRKLMAIFVVAIMLAFVMPSVLQQLSRPSAAQATVAYFGPDGKITNKDIVSARQELNLLQTVWAKQFLVGQQDFRLTLLSELLFHEAGAAAALNRQVNSTVLMKQLPISSRHINDFFAQTKVGNELSPIYWLLLKAEAQKAGIVVSNAFAGQVLSTTIHQLTEGQISANQVVQRIVKQWNVSEEAILETFGQLLAVVVYAQTITSTEGITASQMMHMVSWNTETIDVEFTRFNSSTFVDDQPEPKQAELTEHFEKYRKFFPEQITSENPYGFGYKLLEMVQLEYLALKLDEVTSLVEPPSPEQAEEYYQKHRSEFTTSVPMDPNDPNSEMVERTKTYAEVADSISKQLLQERVNSKASTILSEAKMLSEAGFANVQTEEISDEEFQELAGDYGQAAEQLGRKHKIKLYTGQTGLLTVQDLMLDRYFSMLYIEGQNKRPVSPAKIVFAVKQLEASHLGPYEVPRPRMYENIGPIKDNLDRVMVLLRVIRAEKPTEPTDINQTIDKTGLTAIDENEEDRDTQSLKDIVREDLKKYKAMTTAKSEAEKFVKLVRADEWDKVIEKFNKRYTKKEDKNDYLLPPLRLQQLTDLRRISSQDIKTASLNNDDSPAERTFVYRRTKHKHLIDNLFALVPKDKTSPESLPVIMQFEPEACIYVIKDISRKPTSREEYEREKITTAFQQEAYQAQSLALIHFTPENITKRMKFRWAGVKKPDAEPTKTEPNEVL